jgi:hypothetical protein
MRYHGGVSPSKGAAKKETQASRFRRTGREQKKQA